MNDDYTLDHDWRPIDYIGHYVVFRLNGREGVGRVIDASERGLTLMTNTARIDEWVVDRNKARFSALLDAKAALVPWSNFVGLDPSDELRRQLDALIVINDIAADHELPRSLRRAIASEIERVRGALENVLPY